MIVGIIGEIGRSEVDATVKMAVVVLIGLLVRHCLMWFVV